MNHRPRMAPRSARTRSGRPPEPGIDPQRVAIVCLLYVLGWLPGLVANVIYWSWDRERVERGELQSADGWGMVLAACNLGLITAGVALVILAASL